MMAVVVDSDVFPFVVSRHHRWARNATDLRIVSWDDASNELFIISLMLLYGPSLPSALPEFGDIIQTIAANG